MHKTEDIRLKLLKNKGIKYVKIDILHRFLQYLANVTILIIPSKEINVVDSEYVAKTKWCRVMK